MGETKIYAQFYEFKLELKVTEAAGKIQQMFGEDVIFDRKAQFRLKDESLSDDFCSSVMINFKS